MVRRRWAWSVVVVVVVVRDSPLVVLVSLRCLWLGVVGLDWPGSAMAWLDGRRRCGLRGWGRQWRVGFGYVDSLLVPVAVGVGESHIGHLMFLLRS